MLATTFSLDPMRLRPSTDALRGSIGEPLLTRFPQFSVDSLHDALRDPQRAVASLEPGLTVFPLDDSRFVTEYTADCPFAQAPQLGDFAYGIVPFKRNSGGHHGFAAMIEAGLGRGFCCHSTPCLLYVDQIRRSVKRTQLRTARRFCLRQETDNGRRALS